MKLAMRVLLFAALAGAALAASTACECVDEWSQMGYYDDTAPKKCQHVEHPDDIPANPTDCAAIATEVPCDAEAQCEWEFPHNCYNQKGCPALDKDNAFCDGFGDRWCPVKDPANCDDADHTVFGYCSGTSFDALGVCYEDVAKTTKVAANGCGAGANEACTATNCTGGTKTWSGCACDATWSDPQCDNGCQNGNNAAITWEQDADNGWTQTTCNASGACYVGAAADAAEAATDSCGAGGNEACTAANCDTGTATNVWKAGVFVQGATHDKNGCPAAPCDVHGNSETDSWCHIEKNPDCPLWTADYHSADGGGYMACDNTDDGTGQFTTGDGKDGKGKTDDKKDGSAAGSADGSAASSAAMFTTVVAFVSLLF